MQLYASNIIIKTRTCNPCFKKHTICLHPASHAQQERRKQRRGWDSNPRALSDKQFSRLPRYDHFDTPPYHCDCQRINYISIFHKICQSKKLKNWFRRCRSLSPRIQLEPAEAHCKRMNHQHSITRLSKNLLWTSVRLFPRDCSRSIPNPGCTGTRYTPYPLESQALSHRCRTTHPSSCRSRVRMLFHRS